MSIDLAPGARVGITSPSGVVWNITIAEVDGGNLVSSTGLRFPANGALRIGPALSEDDTTGPVNVTDEHVLAAIRHAVRGASNGPCISVGIGRIRDHIDGFPFAQSSKYIRTASVNRAIARLVEAGVLVEVGQVPFVVRRAAANARTWAIAEEYEAAERIYHARTQAASHDHEHRMAAVEAERRVLAAHREEVEAEYLAVLADQRLLLSEPRS